MFQVPSFKFQEKGQSLVMLLVIVVIAAIILGLGSQFIALRVRTKEVAKQRMITSRLVQESLEATRVIVLEDWHNIDELDDTGSIEYYLYITPEDKWALTTDNFYKSPSGFAQYESWVVFHQALRNEVTGDIVESGGSNDPSTRKVTAHAKHTLSGREISIDYYLTRWQNEIFYQDNWSGNQYSSASGIEIFDDPATPGVVEGWIVLQEKYVITFDTDPPNTGTITFDGIPYNDGEVTEKSSGTYNILANPATGHTFSSWSTTGGLSVATPGNANTTCTVSGDGTLQMIQTTP